MNRNKRNKEPQTPLAAALVGIFVVCFGIFWTVMAGTMFPPMAIFGILFTAIGAVNTYNVYKAAKENAQSKNESSDYSEENQKYEQPEELRCPYCGAPIHKSDTECEYCGSRL